MKWRNFIPKNWIGANDLSNGQYSANKNITPKNPSRRTDLCEYSDTYIFVKGTVIVEDTVANNQTNKKLNFKNNARFRSCIPKINNIFVNSAEDIWYFMPMYNLLE